MKILVIGSGGREHALCWRLDQDGHEVLALPGSTGISGVARCLEGSVGDLDAIVACARAEAVDLVVVGPEVPLVAGLADRLRDAGVAVFGPSARAAQLEGSKSFAKRFFQRHQIRSARFFECSDMAAVEAALDELGSRVVVKADGLAAGKGVVVCGQREEATAAAREILEGRFGEAGRSLIVEERIEGREVSMMALCDGKRYELLAQAEDHKAIFDGDRGPNTGGMGTVSPASWVSEELVARARAEIFDRTMEGLAADGLDFRGVLYAGLMIDAEGAPWLLEYNVRFGDPETQPVLTRMKGDLGAWLYGAARGELPAGTIDWDARSAVCVVLASAGYPESSSKGDVITGCAEADAMEGVTLFHAGTAAQDGEMVTAGGRVLGVSALGSDVGSARELAYAAVDKIAFPGMQYRRDIGARGE